MYTISYKTWFTFKFKTESYLRNDAELWLQQSLNDLSTNEQIPLLFIVSGTPLDVILYYDFIEYVKDSCHGYVLSTYSWKIGHPVTYGHLLYLCAKCQMSSSSHGTIF